LANAAPEIFGSEGHYVETVSRACTNAVNQCATKFSSPEYSLKIAALSCQWNGPSNTITRIGFSIISGTGEVIGTRWIGRKEIDTSANIMNVLGYGPGAPVAFPGGSIPRISFQFSSPTAITFTCTIAGITQQ
jgi:hypothetical protein